MYALGYIIGLTIFAIVFGFITKHISESKGYSGGFAWGFWLGWIGIIVVACKPNLNTRTEVYYKPMYPDAIPQKRQWYCVCGTANDEGLSYCFKCRRTRSESNSIKKIPCPHCGAMNRDGNETCFACNKPMKVSELPSATTEIKATVQPAESESAQILDMLKKLGELHASGILTDDEFQSKKKALLEKL